MPPRLFAEGWLVQVGLLWALIVLHGMCARRTTDAEAGYGLSAGFFVVRTLLIDWVSHYVSPLHLTIMCHLVHLSDLCCGIGVRTVVV